MSRIGKIPVKLPKGVKLTPENSRLRVEGPKGNLILNVPQGLFIDQKEGLLFVKSQSNTKQSRANHGTIRALLVNTLAGVTQGHKRELSVQGIGFRAQLKGQTLVINLGLSHPVEYPVPKEVKVSVPNPNTIIIEGPDKALVGDVAAQIRRLKPPEPYKGKGIRYVDEVVRIKQGKSVTK